MKMEDILRNIARETSTAKLLPIKNACTDALTLLEDDAAMTATECYQVRQKCLYPLQLSLESRSSRLANAAMAGLQKFFVDDRFITSIESDQQECWFPMQVLNTVQNAPNMQEDVQVEIMKLLLKMSFSTAWCLNAIVITKITELALDIYGPSSQISVKTAAKATVTQLLTSITEKLQEKQMATQEDKNNKSNIMDEYSSKNSILADASALCHDVVSILEFLCDKLEKLPSTSTAKSTEPLLLEAIYTVLHNSPISIKENPVFVELIWKRLSPSLIGLLGNPVTDKSLLTSHKKSYDDEIGRGSGSTTTAPPMANAPAKSIYSISVELVRLVGSLKSLRPVLESIFHRMLLYPAAIYRHEALLTIAEVLKTPEFLVNLAGPTLSDKNSTTNTGASKKRLYTDVALLKLIVDSIEECCHCDNSAVCITSVQLIADLLTSVEQLVKGQGLTDHMVTEIHAQYKETDAYIEPEVEGSSGLPSYLGRTIHPIPLIPLPKLEDEVNCKGIEADHTRALLDQDTGEEIIHNAGSADVAANVACDLASDVAGGVSSDVASDVADDMDDNIDTNSEDGLLTVEQETPPTIEAPPIIEAPPTAESPAPTEAVPIVETPPVLTNELESKARQAMLQKKAAYDLVEKESAQIYIHKLQEMLPSLLQSYSIHDIDQQLLLFASELCEENVQESHTHSGPSATLNGDGVYLATMYTLLLNLKLICAGYYTSEEKSLPISEERFLDEVLGSGLIVYLSPVWVSSVYHQVINVNLLEEAGFGENNADVPLIHLLTDIDGLGSRQIGGQLMTSFSSNSDLLGQRSINEGQEPKDKNTIEAGQKFARRLLLVCWDSILEVLSVLLNGSSACGITSSLALLVGGMEETQRARQAVCTSLDGLQKAARLSCILGLQDRCGAVFSQLAASCCVIEDFRREERKATKPGNKPSVLPSAKPKLTKLHTSHALSMDVVLCIGLEMGSHSADCWKHVFRCCAHLSELEHTYFSSGDNQTNLPKVGLHQEQMNQHMDNGAFDMEMDELYTGVVTSVEPIAPSINVADLINKSRSEAGWDSAMMGREVLSANQAAQVLCGLSQQVDRLFEDASNKMNMKAFVSFIRELCQASQDQLSAYSHYSDLHGPGCPSIPNNALHLYRLGDVLMRCIEGDRPMIHVMKAWSVAVPHLVDCACHWDHNISKKAVNCIHEFITNLLSKHKEHQHFHFNEALCKPFENLVCLELCDGDTQDQIVCSICELVEACANDIHSGWRPLFGALRAIKVEYTTMEDVNEARQRHIEAVLDVFDVFLNSDNIIVFAYAAVDCIMCLLKYVKGPGEFESVGDGDSDSGSELTPATLGEDLCLPALKYLQQCCTLLGSMWTMPACPIFHAANSIHISPIPKIVDPIIHGIDLKAFQKPFNEHKLNAEKKDISPTTDDKDPPTDTKAPPTDTKDQLTDTKAPPTDAIAPPTNYLPEDNKAASSSREVSPGRGDAQDAKSVTSNDSGIQGEETQHTDNVPTDPAADTPISLSSQYIGTPLEQLDKPTGVLRVWYLVLDGLAMTANSCPKTFQPQTLEVLFDLLRSAAKLPGPEFSLHCMNHLVLPMIQNWLRKGAHLSTFWDGSVSNFRQCCGLCTDLVVEYVIQFATVSEHQVAVHFMLQQLLDVLTECVSQSNEALARLGCSCIRHCIMSTGQVAHESVWRLMLDSLERALDITLYSLKQLMTPFKEDSDNFYGDVGHVKIAVRKDCSGIECERLRQLAQQVFLLDNQRGTSSIIDYEVEEDRSYIFLIYPPNHEQAPNPNLIVTRVPFRNLVVGLLSHQLLIQLIGTLLLQGSTFMVKSERNVLPQTPLEQEPPQTPTSPTQKNLLHEENLPGMLPHLSTRNVLLLLTCLEKSYFIASQFDCRPGLKFLVQKVSRADVATNLYCYSSLSLTFLMHTLIVINSHMDNVCLENTRKILSQPRQIDANLSLESDLLDDPMESTHKIGYTPEYITALTSLSSIDQHSGLFLRRLRVWFDEICKVYVDLYLDKEGPSKADELSSNMLVFLLAPEEELPQIKRDKSISEMVAEKLKSKKRADSVEQTEPVAVQPKISEVDQSSFDAGSEFPSNTCPTSPVKDRHQTCNDDKVYRVVTDKGIQSMMSEYKKRKQQKTMPAFVKAQRSKPVKKIPRPISLDPIDKEIDQQQQRSIMKDGEAHLVSFIEMLVSVLDVLFQLPDSHFQALQPAAFHCITQLICHCKDLRLRRSLAQWTHRIGHMFSITAPNEAINKY